MYAEMLAEGMVEDEANRRRYLQTLRLEADRLTHLVENVLAYARLERGRPEGRIGPISVATILQHGDRLSERLLQSGLELLIDADQCTQSARALADASAVEQILFNLVDNACKYASSTGNHLLHLEADARRAVRQTASARSRAAFHTRIEPDCFNRFANRPTRRPVRPRESAWVWREPPSGTADGRRAEL